MLWYNGKQNYPQVSQERSCVIVPTGLKLLAKAGDPVKIEEMHICVLNKRFQGNRIPCRDAAIRTV